MKGGGRRGRVCKSVMGPLDGETFTFLVTLEQGGLIELQFGANNPFSIQGFSRFSVAMMWIRSKKSNGTLLRRGRQLIFGNL